MQIHAQFPINIINKEWYVSFLKSLLKGGEIGGIYFELD